MAIKINDIPPEGMTIDVLDKADLFQEGAKTASFQATVKIKPEGSGLFHISGTLTATAVLECSRCLKEFDFAVKDAVMDFDLAPERLLEAPGEHELGRGELDMEFYKGDEIEPADVVREQVLLALPMVPVHASDCKGLCPVCGVDRNEKKCTCTQEAMESPESPFAVLKKIIKPEKE
ncbi:MAG: DUF177 domain-containing protein [Nitrospirota bacterium]|nr:DUF177 domain-containing protein [Nitrospirota bacterium]